MSGDQSGPVELNGTGTAGDGSGVDGIVTNGGTPGREVTMNGGGGEAITPGGGGGSEAGGLGGLSTVDAGCSEGPSSIIGVGPPSPLTGCYLLIIIGEPHSQDHKDIILQRLVKGFLSWDATDCHVDLEEELHTITLQALEGEEGKHGERLIQYASENLVTEILIHPQINTFIQCIRNLLSSFTRHRHIIHAGYTFAGNGSWVLQDGTFSVVDFMEAFQEHEVQRVLRAYPETITMDVHCAPVGNWQAIQDKTFARLCRIRLNPVDVLSSGSEKLNAFVDYLASMIVPTEISELLESSDVVGNIRFSHPTLYVFPGGQGDAALFGINGFNMLVDGGFSRKSCFWDFVRHLDRLDAVLMTRINNTNIKGISAVVERKHEAHVYPQIGHFFCNIPERKGLLSPDGDKDRDPLLVDLIEEGHQIVNNLKTLNLKAQNCYRDAEPINLYHKVGHGTLDMYVISPAKDSKEVKEFLAKWNAADPKLFSPKDSKEFVFPMQNIISICALLVWTPANPEDNITRILFPGSAPEYKILEGLEKMKSVEFMRQPVCTVKSIASSISTQTIMKKSLKSSSIDKIIPEPILPSKSTKPSEKDNKILDNKMKMIDNRLADSTKSSSDMMDSSADEAKLEKHITKSSVAAITTAKVTVSKSKVIKTTSTESTKKIDSMLIETSKKIDLDEKKDSSDAGSEKDENEKKETAEDSIPEKKLIQDRKDDESKESKKEETVTAKDETKATRKVSDKPTRPITARSRFDTKPPKATTKTIKKKEDTKSSPTTPKKSVEPKLTNGVSKDDEPKKAVGPPKTTKPMATRPGKASPKSTPAKSAKDANNRKVLEARQRPAAKPAPAKRDSTEKKESPPKVERKPISRRPKAPASAAPVGGSPVKAKKVLKSEKDAVIRKAKLDKNGTTDSSLVSTPSADEAGVAVQKRIVDSAVSTTTAGSDIDSIQQQHLDELKEEQEAVREIEAVFKRDSEKIKRREVLSEHREIQDSATEPEEEEEYLIIEKEEQYTEDSINEPESSATKEEEIQKHQRDSQESEKRKRDSLDDEKEEKADVGKIEGETAAVVEIIEGEKDEEQQEEEVQQDDKENVLEKEAVEDVKEEPREAEKLSPKHKQDIEEEVQDIIASAKEIAKSKMETSMDGLKTEEMSSISPDEKMSSTKKTSDTREETEPEPIQKEHIEPPHESHHEERVSATAESGATTTAPTLPEDERIPLDEIKEDLVIEEKHVKEETKEVEIAPPLPTVYEPLERPTPAKMHFSAQQAHMRDVVKTPDEVADLPMHEEADFEEYSEDKDKEDGKERDIKEKPEVADTAQKQETDVKQPEKTDKVVVDKSAESDKLCDTVKDAKQEVQEIVEKVEIDTMVEKPPKLDTQQLAKDKQDEAAVLEDLESQIISTEPEIKKQPEVVKLEQEPEQVIVDDEEDKKSVHEDVIVATKVEPVIPVTEPSVLDEIWSAPQKVEEKLDELKQIIDDKAKETTSDLVAVKDEMIKEVIERKEDVLDKVKQEIIDTDKKVKETVTELGEEAEKVAVQFAGEIVKDLSGKADAVGEELHEKALQLDEKLASEVNKIKTGVEQVATKAEKVLDTIETEKKELEKLATDIKQEVSGKIDETKKQIDAELNKAAEQVQEKAKSGISSFFGDISESIKLGIEKVADKVETKLKDKTEQIETRLQEVSDKIEEIKGKEVVEEVCEKKEEAKAPASSDPAVGFETPFGYERTFTQELRETHITTLDSPISDGDKMVDLKSTVKIPQNIDEDKELEELESKQMTSSYIIEEVKYSSFEDANLREIKEEEEEDRVTPPQKGSSPKLEPLVAPPRARTPEDVAKIVANVAEVLKSDKDLEEIIPDFDPHELERKLSQGIAREEDVGTVQRMLVTASSEDGGEETVICPDGTITFSKSATPEPPASGKTTPEIKVDDKAVENELSGAKHEKPQLPEVKQDEKSSPASSGKSSPDLKTSPTSIEEKDKHELPEKVVIEARKTPDKATEDRKESIADQYDQIDDSRRESAISTFSERDYTKDESSILDERDSSRAHSISSHISDLKEDAADAKSAADFIKESDKQQDVFAEPEKQKDTSAKKSEELSSPESITSQKTVSEKSVAAEAVAPAHPDEKSLLDDKSKKESSRPESVISHASEKAPSDKVSEAAELSRPQSAASADKSPQVETKVDTSKDQSRPESAASHLSEKSGTKSETQEPSRLDSATPEKLKQDVVKEASRPESAASHVSEKGLADKVEAPQESQPASRPDSSAVTERLETEADDKLQSRPESVVSHVSDKQPSDKIDIKLEETTKSSRPESAASHVSEPISSEQIETATEEVKKSSRAESVASHISEKEAEELQQETKDASRPDSVASHVSEKASPEKKDVKIDEVKETSRPASVASQIDDKSPPEQKQTTTSEKTETNLGETKEVLRPESTASNVSETSEVKKDEIKDVGHTGKEVAKESVPLTASEKISDKTETNQEKPSGDSRPQSVVSQVDEKAPAETVKVEDDKHASRPESAASHISETTSAEKPEPKQDETIGDIRSGSAASHISDKDEGKKEDSKEVSRPESVASHTSEKQDVKDDTASVKVETKSVESKEVSRPESVASQASEKISDDKDTKKDVKEDISSEKGETKLVESKEASRPESVASHASEKIPDDKETQEDAKHDITSEKSATKLEENKEVSRPESVASHISETVTSEKETKEQSRPESASSHISEKITTEKDDTKEASRPESRTSQGSGAADTKLETSQRSGSVALQNNEELSQTKQEEKDLSRAESAASHVSEQASEKLDAKLDDSKEKSRPESVASNISEKADIVKESSQSSGVPSQLGEKTEELRPESAASNVSEKTSEKQDTKQEGTEEALRPESVASDKTVEKVDSKQEEIKDVSRPDSVASHLSDKATKDKQTKQEEVSRPESATSQASEKASEDIHTKQETSPAETVTSHLGEQAPEKHEEVPRPESATSHASDKTSEKSDAKLGEPKEPSRPESAASHRSEKTSAETVDVKDSTSPITGDVKQADIEDHKPTDSVVSHVDERKPSVQGEVEVVSRPESVASHDSVKAPEKEDSKKEDVKEVSRPESVASEVSEKITSEKSETKKESVEVEQLKAIASQVSEKVAINKSDIELTESKKPIQQETVTDKTETKSELKDSSRPQSASSQISDKEPSKDGSKSEDRSRPESAISEKASLTEDKATESKDDSAKSEEKGDSRPASESSHVSEKHSPAMKDSSRPDSAASHVSEKGSLDQTLPQKETSPPESAVTDKSPTKDTKPEEKSLQGSESRPSSVASHISEKVSLDKSSEKDESRPASAVSHISESGPSEKLDVVKSEDKDVSRPASTASHVSDKADAVDDKIATVSETGASQPSKNEPSSTSEKVVKDTSDSAPIDQSQASRPESVASDKLDKSPVVELKLANEEHLKSTSVCEKETRKAASEKELSRPVSAASNVSDSAQHASRPESAQSHVSTKTQETDNAHKEDSKEEKATSQPVSVASSVSDEKAQAQPETVALKESKVEDIESSQPKPASVTSIDKVGDGDYSRPESPASFSSDKLETSKEPASAHVERDLARPDSACSYHGEPIPDEKTFSRPQSPDSFAEDKLEETKLKTELAHKSDDTLTQETKSVPKEDYSDQKEFSRPSSPASCGDEPELTSKSPDSSVPEKNLARKDSVESYHGEPIPGEKQFSRPDSPASGGEDDTVDNAIKCQEILKPESTSSLASEKDKSPIVNGDDASEHAIESKEASRPASTASHTSDKDKSPVVSREDASESAIKSKEASRPESTTSHTSDKDKSPVASEKDASESALKTTETSRPESAASHTSDKDKSPVVGEVKSLKKDEGQASRPTSAASHISEKSTTIESKTESRRESAVQEDRPSSAMSDHEDEREEKIILKESRSKSLSAVMSTTTQRIGFEGSALGVLDESAATSRDDLHILKTPRESITKIEEMSFTERKVQPIASKTTMSLFGPSQFPAEEKQESTGFPVAGSEHESPDQTDSIIPGVDRLLKETASSMKEIEKMSSTVISMIQTTEKKAETVKQDSKSSTLAFPLLDSGKSTPMSVEKDKSQTSSIKSTSPHDKDSLEGSSASLNTFIEKDSLSESTSKQVTIKMSAVEEITDSKTMATSTKVESIELLGGTKTPPTAPISPNVGKEDFSLGHHIESTVASTTATTVTSTSQMSVKQQKEDASGISTPKESVPSGKSSPGLMSVHTGSTDSASKSINLGHSSGIETSESSPKPTSPFPKVLDTLKTDDVKTSSGMSTPDMTRTSTPDMVDSQIERISKDLKDDVKEEVTTTTTTTTKRYIIKDGEKIEVGSTVKTEVSGDSKKDDISSAGESLSTSTTTTTTTTKAVKEVIKTPANLTLSSTEDRSLTDEYDEKDVLSPRSDISSGQASRIVAGWHDEDVPGSPMSVTSQAPLSPSTKYTYDYELQHSSSGVSKKSDIEIDDSQDEIPPQYGSDEVKSAITIVSAYKPDPMSTSFYGQLPDVSDSTITTSTTTTKSVPIPITAGKAFTKTYMEYASSGDSSVDSSHLHKASDRKYLDEADLDFEKVFTKSDNVDLMTQSMHFSSETEFMAGTTTTSSAMTTVADSSKKELDFTASGLPATVTALQAQTTQTTTAQSSTTVTTSGSSTQQAQSDKEKDTLASWGKPLGLPSPAPLNDENMKTTPKKERRMILSKTKLNNEKNLRKRSESPIKAAKKPSPVYVDLSYVPHHGNSYYANVEFFKRVRARYYVFSGTEPSREVYNALLEAKQTWEDKELEVTIIPTYDTDVLGYWVSENEDLLAKYHIDLSPSAARCTINLQDHETSCSAYRLEF